MHYNICQQGLSFASHLKESNFCDAAAHSIELALEQQCFGGKNIPFWITHIASSGTDHSPFTVRFWVLFQTQNVEFCCVDVPWDTMSIPWSNNSWGVLYNPFFGCSCLFKKNQMENWSHFVLFVKLATSRWWWLLFKTLGILNYNKKLERSGREALLIIKDGLIAYVVYVAFICNYVPYKSIKAKMCWICPFNLSMHVGCDTEAQ